MIYNLSIKPSEVYDHNRTPENILSMLSLRNYRIVAFRPPHIGEKFITKIGPREIDHARQKFERTQPRFVVESLATEVAPADWWE